jgi:hypothetical protein
MMSYVVHVDIPPRRDHEATRQALALVTQEYLGAGGAVTRWDCRVTGTNSHVSFVAFHTVSEPPESRER